MTKPSGADLYAVIRHIRPAFKHIAEVVEIKSKELGLSVGTRAVLEQVCEHGAIPVPAIAKYLLVERQYVQRNVNELLGAKLVERRQNPTHKRSWLIVPTNKGQKLFAKLKERESAVLAPLCQDLNLSEVQGAEKTLSYLSQYFGEISDKKGPENDR